MKRLIEKFKSKIGAADIPEAENEKKGRKS